MLVLKMVGTVVAQPWCFLCCGRNCAGAGPWSSSLSTWNCWQEAGSTRGPAPPVGTHSPQQPFLRPGCLPAAPDTGRPRGFLVRPVAGRVSLFHSRLSSSKPMLTAHQLYSAESVGPGSLVIKAVFCQPVRLFSRAHPSAGPESGRDQSLGRCLKIPQLPDSCRISYRWGGWGAAVPRRVNHSEVTCGVLVSLIPKHMSIRAHGQNITEKAIGRLCLYKSLSATEEFYYW